MGQFQGLMASPRVEFDENGENGLLIMDKYLPEELLSEILFHVDHKTLLNCQLVCKRWYMILQNYVWRKKAEAVIGRPLHFQKRPTWLPYYIICSKKSLEKNLLKNHSGKEGRRCWNILREGGDLWEVECPPIGAPPPPISEPVFEGRQHCFVTSYYNCCKEQTVDLLPVAGFFPELLDEIQPPVTVSEWYCSRVDCPAEYRCSAKLMDKSGKVLDSFEFHDILQDENQNVWLYVQHEFKNYGPGLRKVTFTHEGMDRRTWRGHYGSKMAGACVMINLPNQKSSEL